MKQAAVTAFQDTVWEYYRAHGRHDLPWRIPEADGNFDPYKILVSEVMLQQTQVIRCIPIYRKLIYRFPSVFDLAAAPLSDVLIAWSGLGYNRRAKFLHQAAQMLVRDFGGTFPHELHELVKLPGVGKNTAGAIMAYAFNAPVAFLETNIRTVFIHHFFQDKANISDLDILELVRPTLPGKGKEQSDGAIYSSPGTTIIEQSARGYIYPAGVSPYRTWYWALMDYGSFLKKSVGNLNKLSKQYAKQSAFQGSRRQIRGQVLRLLATGSKTPAELAHHITDTRLPAVLDSLTREGLVGQKNGSYQLGS